MSLDKGPSLLPGQSLAVNEFLSNGTFIVIMQPDGNLVLYGEGPNGRFPIWASQTVGLGGHVCKMQADGNLVMFNSKNHPVWASGTNGYPGAGATVTASGAFVIERPEGEPIWQNGQITGFVPHAAGQ